jgi:hypothetical protein
MNLSTSQPASQQQEGVVRRGVSEPSEAFGRRGLSKEALFLVARQAPSGNWNQIKDIAGTPLQTDPLLGPGPGTPEGLVLHEEPVASQRLGDDLPLFGPGHQVKVSADGGHRADNEHPSPHDAVYETCRISHLLDDLSLLLCCLRAQPSRRVLAQL